MRNKNHVVYASGRATEGTRRGYQMQNIKFAWLPNLTLKFHFLVVVEHEFLPDNRGIRKHLF